MDVENLWRLNRGGLGYEDVTTHAVRATPATGLDVAGMSAAGSPNAPARPSRR